MLATSVLTGATIVLATSVLTGATIVLATSVLSGAYPSGAAPLGLHAPLGYK